MTNTVVKGECTFKGRQHLQKTEKHRRSHNTSSTNVPQSLDLLTCQLARRWEPHPFTCWCNDGMQQFRPNLTDWLCYTWKQVHLCQHTHKQHRGDSWSIAMSGIPMLAPVQVSHSGRRLHTVTQTFTLQAETVNIWNKSKGMLQKPKLLYYLKKLKMTQAVIWSRSTFFEINQQHSSKQTGKTGSFKQSAWRAQQRLQEMTHRTWCSTLKGPERQRWGGRQ